MKRLAPVGVRISEIPRAAAPRPQAPYLPSCLAVTTLAEEETSAFMTSQVPAA